MNLKKSVFVFSLLALSCGSEAGSDSQNPANDPNNYLGNGGPDGDPCAPSQGVTIKTFTPCNKGDNFVAPAEVPPTDGTSGSSGGSSSGDVFVPPCDLPDGCSSSSGGTSSSSGGSSSGGSSSGDVGSSSGGSSSGGETSSSGGSSSGGTDCSCDTTDGGTGFGCDGSGSNSGGSSSGGSSGGSSDGGSCTGCSSQDGGTDVPPTDTSDAGTNPGSDSGSGEDCDAGTPEQPDSGTVNDGGSSGDTGPVCTRTIGYWMTHPEVWTVSSLTLGGVVYSKADCLSLLSAPSNGDASLILAKQLMAALLNGGANDPAVSATVKSAQSWLSNNKDTDGTLPYNVKTSSVAGTEAVNLATVLDNYNNGLVSKPHCN